MSEAQQTPLLYLEGISKIYGSGDTEVKALDGIDLVINEGEFVAVMGSSGSGKSTCMNILGCLDKPTDGRYEFHGVEVGSLSADEQALLRRGFIGFVFQSFNLIPRTSAIENVELPLIYRGVRRSERRKMAMRSLELVGLAERAHHSPSQLSGGQQQRVAIARALVTNPSVLFADEPTGNLDSTRSAEIMSLLQNLNEEQGITIVMVTHEPDIAMATKRAIIFRDGRVVADGVPKEVLS
jgi:putative ABC transport system ATP-binding protein